MVHKKEKIVDKTDKTFSFDTFIHGKAFTSILTALNEQTGQDISGAFYKVISGAQMHQVQGMPAEQIEAVYALGYNAYNTGAYADAETLFRFAMMFAHMQPKYVKALGGALQMQEKYEEALRVYAYLSFLEPESPEAYLQIAVCYLRLRDAHSAMQALEIAEVMSGDTCDKSRLHALKDVCRSLQGKEQSKRATSGSPKSSAHMTKIKEEKTSKSSSASKEHSSPPHAPVSKVSGKRGSTQEQPHASKVSEKSVSSKSIKKNSDKMKSDTLFSSPEGLMNMGTSVKESQRGTKQSKLKIYSKNGRV